jgi:hypothetical protein
MTDFTDLWPAYDVALIARGLLGPVDELWKRHIDGTGVTVLFSQKKYQDEFLARWQSLIEADWYLDSLHSMPDETSETSGSNYTLSGLLTFDELYAEVGRLKAALTAGGILGADRFDLTTLSVQSKMVQFDLLGESLDLADLDFRDFDDGSRNVPVKFSIANATDMANFGLALTNAASREFVTSLEAQSGEVSGYVH